MKFTSNGTEYEGAKYDYNTHCDLKDMGVDIARFNKNPEGVVRAYFAVSSGMDLKMAGDEINQHVINGGSLDGIVNTLSEEINKSGFFQALKGNTEAKKPAKKE